MESVKPEIFEEIKKQVASSDIVLYMKGSPNFPQCGFSAVVSHILTSMDVPFESVDVLRNPEIRQGIKEFSDWPTIPQLYIKGEFIGGCDIVKEMHQNGELAEILTKHGIKN